MTQSPSDGTTRAGVPTHSDAGAVVSGAERWIELSDAMMRGLNHALSNRIGTVWAIAAVLEPRVAGVETPRDPLADAFSLEMRRLEELLELMRMLPRLDDEPEAVRLGDVAAAVLALNAHRAEAPEVECAIGWSVEPAPVLVERRALTHALLALIASACDVAVAHRGDRVSIECAGGADDVTLDVRVGGGAWSVQPGTVDLIVWRLQGCAVRVARAKNGSLTLSVPTLAASRAADR